MTPTKISIERTIALEVLEKAQKNKVWIQTCLEEAFLNTKLTKKQRALTWQLAIGSTKMKGYCDWIMKQFATRPLSKMDRRLRLIIRLGIYQLCFLTKIPAYAAIDQAIQMAKQLPNKRSAGFVNALLRKVIKHKTDLARTLASYPEAKRISIETSHPLWLTKRWIARWNMDKTKQLLLSNNQSPRLIARINPWRQSIRTIVNDLEKEGVTLQQSPHHPLAYEICSLPAGKTLSTLDSFIQGDLYLQDESTMMVVDLLAPRKNESILDYCAAPGGKTTDIGQRMNNTGTIVACDVSDDKLTLIQDNLTRLGLTNTVCYNLSDKALPYTQGSFDRVLVDAPCSNSGVLRRRPEARWNITQASLERLSKLQRGILGSAARYLKPKGCLVYATCSIDPEENQQVVHTFLAKNRDFILESSTCSLPQSNGPDGYSAFKLRLGSSLAN